MVTGSTINVFTVQLTNMEDKTLEINLFGFTDILTIKSKYLKDILVLADILVKIFWISLCA